MLFGAYVASTRRPTEFSWIRRLSLTYRSSEPVPISILPRQSHRLCNEAPLVCRFLYPDRGS